MGRVIKVTKCGEQNVCGVNDRVSIEFTPFEIIALTRTFGKQALTTKSKLPGNAHAMRNVFTAARDIWAKMRKNKKRNFTDEDIFEFEKKVSVLPLFIGNPNEPPSEVITCTSISKQDYVSAMPRELTLVRKLACGVFHTARYKRMVKKRRRKTSDQNG